jgi:hypothetical protein
VAGLLSTQLVHHQFVADFQPPAPLREEDRIKTVIRGRQLNPA